MLNKIIVCGRITHTPELKRTPSGTSVCSFSIACERDFKNSDGEKETDFLDIVTFKNTAEYVTRYAERGSVVIVEGRLQIRNWTDKEGNKRRNAEVIANSVYTVGGNTSRSENNAQSDSTTGNEYVAAVAKQFTRIEVDDDFDVDVDVPF